MNIYVPLLTQRHGTRERRVDSQLVVNWHITSDGPRSCPLEVGHNPKRSSSRAPRCAILRLLDPKMKDKPSADRERNGNVIALILASCRAPLAHRQSS